MKNVTAQSIDIARMQTFKTMLAQQLQQLERNDNTPSLTGPIADWVTKIYAKYLLAQTNSTTSKNEQDFAQDFWIIPYTPKLNASQSTPKKEDNSKPSHYIVIPKAGRFGEGGSAFIGNRKNNCSGVYDCLVLSRGTEETSNTWAASEMPQCVKLFESIAKSVRRSEKISWWANQQHHKESKSSPSIKPFETKIAEQNYTVVVMDKLSGKAPNKKNLEQRYARSTQLEILSKKVAAVRQLHSAENGKIPLIHGDLKPENMVCTIRKDDGQPVVELIDMGTCKIQDEACSQGYTLQYAAPELLFSQQYDFLEDQCKKVIDILQSKSSEKEQGKLQLYTCREMNTSSQWYTAPINYFRQQLGDLIGNDQPKRLQDIQIDKVHALKVNLFCDFMWQNNLRLALHEKQKLAHGLLSEKQVAIRKKILLDKNKNTAEKIQQVAGDLINEVIPLFKLTENVSAANTQKKQLAALEAILTMVPTDQIAAFIAAAAKVRDQNQLLDALNKYAPQVTAEQYAKLEHGDFTIHFEEMSLSDKTDSRLKDICDYTDNGVFKKALSVLAQVLPTATDSNSKIDYYPNDIIKAFNFMLSDLQSGTTIEEITKNTQKIGSALTQTYQQIANEIDVLLPTKNNETSPQNVSMITSNSESTLQQVDHSQPFTLALSKKLWPTANSTTDAYSMGVMLAEYCGIEFFKPPKDAILYHIAKQLQSDLTSNLKETNSQITESIKAINQDWLQITQNLKIQSLQIDNIEQTILSLNQIAQAADSFFYGESSPKDKDKYWELFEKYRKLADLLVKSALLQLSQQLTKTKPEERIRLAEAEKHLQSLEAPILLLDSIAGHYGVTQGHKIWENYTTVKKSEVVTCKMTAAEGNFATTIENARSLVSTAIKPNQTTTDKRITLTDTRTAHNKGWSHIQGLCAPDSESVNMLEQHQNLNPLLRLLRLLLKVFTYSSKDRFYATHGPSLPTGLKKLRQTIACFKNIFAPTGFDQPEEELICNQRKTMSCSSS